MRIKNEFRLLQPLQTMMSTFAKRMRPKMTKIGRPRRVAMTEQDEARLMKELDFNTLNRPETTKLLEGFTIESREDFALRTKSMVIYFPDEIEPIRRSEEAAALKAAPVGHGLEVLNGINVGCGDRRVSEHLTPVDIMRQETPSGATGTHHAFLPDALLANPEDLPFKEGSLDYIVALHMLEHVSDPIAILRYWHGLLKPGGGIGLVLPDFEYTWDARLDASQYGHKWNSNAQNLRALFDEYLQDLFLLEQLGTLKRKISFDVVLRKPGEFVPFAISNATSTVSGAELGRVGKMVC